MMHLEECLRAFVGKKESSSKERRQRLALGTALVAMLVYSLAIHMEFVPSPPPLFAARSSASEDMGHRRHEATTATPSSPVEADLDVKQWIGNATHAVIDAFDRFKDAVALPPSEDGENLWQKLFMHDLVDSDIELGEMGYDDEYDSVPCYFKPGVSRARAVENFHATLRWREENDMDNILASPSSHFDVINQALPFTMYLPDKAGRVVIVEKFGFSTAEQMASSSNITTEDLIHHYKFQLEWLWSVAHQHDEDMVTMIMDLKHVNWGMLTQANIDLVKERIKIGCGHYPNRAANSFVVNVPTWASAGYQIVSPLISEQTKEKIRFVTSEDIKRGVLLEYIDAENLLPEYGGTSQVPFGQAPLDTKQRTQAQRILKRNAATVRSSL